MSRSRPRTFHFSQQFQRLSSYEEFAKLDQGVAADSANLSQQPPQSSIEASIRQETSNSHAPKRSSVSPMKHLSQELNNQLIKSPNNAIPNGIAIELKDSQLQGQHAILGEKIPTGAQSEKDNAYQGYSYFKMPFEQQPFRQDQHELSEEDLTFLLEFNQKTKRKTDTGLEGDNQLDIHMSSLKEITPEDMSKLLVYFENRSTRGTTATVKEMLFEIPDQIQSLLNEEELILFYEYWKNLRQNLDQFRQGEPNAPKEICPLLRKFWRATIEEKSYNQTFRPHISQKMSTRKTTRPESEIHERLLQLQADFDKHRMLSLKLKKREQIKREIAFVQITDFNSSIPGLSAAFSIQNKFTSRAQDIRNISNIISPKHSHKLSKHSKHKTHDVPQKDSLLQPQDDQAAISPNRGQNDKMSGSVLTGNGRSKEDQNNKVEESQKVEDPGEQSVNVQKKKKKKLVKKATLEQEGTQKQDPNNQEIESQNQGIDAVQNSLKVSKKKPQKSQEESGTAKNSGIKSQKNIQNSINQQNRELNVQEQNSGVQGSQNIPLKYEQQSLYPPGEADISSEISKVNKGDYFAPPEKKKRETKPRQKIVLLNTSASDIAVSDRRASLIIPEQISINNKIDEQNNMSLNNNKLQVKGSNNKLQSLKLGTQEEIVQFLSSFYLQFQLSRLPVSIENIGSIEKILETSKDMHEEDKRKIKNQNIVAFQIIKRLGRSNRECIDRKCAELQDVFGIQSGKVSYFLNSTNEVIYNTFNYANPEVLNYFGMVESEMSQKQASQMGNNADNVEQEQNDGNNQLRKDQKAKIGMGVQKDFKQKVTTQQPQYLLQKQEKLRQIIRQPLEFQEKKRKKRRLLNSDDHILWTEDATDDDEDGLIENDENFKKSLSSLKQKMERKQKEKEKQLKMQQKILLEQQKQKEKELQAEKMLAQQVLNGQQGIGQQGKVQQEQQSYQVKQSSHQDEQNTNYQPYFSQQFQTEQQSNYYFQNPNQQLFNQPPELKNSPSSSFYNPNQMYNSNDANISMQPNLLNFPQQQHPLNDFRINQNYDQRHTNGFNQMLDVMQSPGQDSQLNPENLQIQRDPSILNLNSQFSNDNQLPNEHQLLSRKQYDGDQIGQGFYQEPPFSIYQTNENIFRKNEEPNIDGDFPQLFSGIPNQQLHIEEDQDINDYLNGDEEQQEQQQFQINDDF